jgi:hypothetical protein
LADAPPSDGTTLNVFLQSSGAASFSENNVSVFSVGDGVALGGALGTGNGIYQGTFTPR